MTTDIHLQQLSIAAERQKRDTLASAGVPDVDAKTVDELKTFAGGLDKHESSLTARHHAVNGAFVDCGVDLVSHCHLVQVPHLHSNRAYTWGDRRRDSCRDDRLVYTLQAIVAAMIACSVYTGRLSRRETTPCDA